MARPIDLLLRRVRRPAEFRPVVARALSRTWTFNGQLFLLDSVY